MLVTDKLSSLWSSYNRTKSFLHSTSDHFHQMTNVIFNYWEFLTSQCSRSSFSFSLQLHHQHKNSFITFLRYKLRMFLTIIFRDLHVGHTYIYHWPVLKSQIFSQFYAQENFITHCFKIKKVTFLKHYSLLPAFNGRLFPTCEIWRFHSAKDSSRGLLDRDAV